MSRSRSKSSSRWLREHFSDPYVTQAQQQGYRSRSAYKLLAIDTQARLLRPGMTVIDLGAAPGGWSQVAAQSVGRNGTVVAVDRLPMPPIEGVTFIHGDFLATETVQALLTALQDRTPDLVMSDLAPNFSGIPTLDQARWATLADGVMDFTHQCLQSGGTMLLKAFQCPECETLRETLKNYFAKVVLCKPAASRSRSAEVYLLARNYRSS